MSNAVWMVPHPGAQYLGIVPCPDVVCAGSSPDMVISGHGPHCTSADLNTPGDMARTLAIRRPLANMCVGIIIIHNANNDK